MFKTLLASLLLVLALPAQQVAAMWAPTIVPSCSNCNLLPVDMLSQPGTWTPRPLVGQQITLVADTVPNASEGTWAVTLTWHDVNSSWYPIPDLSSIGCDACYVVGPADFSDSMSIPIGSSISYWTVTIPNDPQLVGWDVHFQAAIFSSAYTCGLATSTALYCKFGNV